MYYGATRPAYIIDSRAKRSPRPSGRRKVEEEEREEEEEGGEAVVQYNKQNLTQGVRKNDYSKIAPLRGLPTET